MHCDDRFLLEKRAEKAVAALKAAGLHIAVAESCTGGLLAQLITSVSGASGVFDFGAVTYSNAMKSKLLAVPESILAQFGAVSEPTARQMAKGIMSYAEADIGIGITGIAGPGADGTGKPVGLIYVAFADRKGYIRVKQLKHSFTENVRENNRNAAVRTAFDLIDAYFMIG